MQYYIDPGTGSMLFTVLIGILGAGVYALRDFFVKLRFYLSGGKAASASDERPAFVIFSDHKRYWNVFQPICDEFERRGEKIIYMTASEDDPALAMPYEHVEAQFIGEGNKAYAKLNMLKADVVLSTTPSLDVFYWKRAKDVKWYVHIPHAASDLTLYRMFGIDYYDAILTSGDYHEEQIRALEKVRNLPAKEIVKCGLTFMDTAAARRDSLPPAGEHGTTVLLAPSWGQSAILTRFGSKAIDVLLATGYHIIIRPHPQSFTSEKEMLDGLMAQYPNSEQLEWNTDNDNFDVLSRSDILISDFSGVIFDYCLVFDKPVIYTAADFDDAPYDACWLEEEPWTFRMLPRIGKELTEESLPAIKDLIDTCLQDVSFRKARDEARDETWAFRGEAAVRVTDYLLQKQKELTEESPETESPESKSPKKESKRTPEDAK